MRHLPHSINIELQWFKRRKRKSTSTKIRLISPHTYLSRKIMGKIIPNMLRRLERRKNISYEPDRLVVLPEQGQVPTTDLLVHIEEPLLFYQRREDSVPQQQLPEIKIHEYYKPKVLSLEIIEVCRGVMTHPNLCFRRQVLQTVSKDTILTQLSTIPFSRCKKLSHCWFWTITFLVK